MDNDDELSVDALYEVVKVLNEKRETDFIYSDEDKINDKSVRYSPFFKPDWSPDTLRSCNYITHFAVIRKNIVQDSVAKDPEAKLYAYDSAKRALSDHIQRLALDGKVLDGELIPIGTYRIKYITNDCPKVSILIKSKDDATLLKRCINSIFNLTSYENYSIIVYDNGSVDEETLRYYDSLRGNRKVSVSEYKESIGLSAINISVNKIDSEYIIFLDNDIEVISPDWITKTIEFAQRKDVGAVGALLYYTNGKIQHAGLILDIGDVVGNYKKCNSSPLFLKLMV